MEVMSDARTQHRYQACRDEECQRFACRVYKEGYRAGYDVGEAEGYQKGHAFGYIEGYAAGASSASGSG
jgi:flagellar biosynthesis/type III secretory pathway protein FliH